MILTLEKTSKVSASHLPAEPKIAICGTRFLCGFAGYSPIITGNFKYDFQDWISSIKVDDHTSVREFADSVQVKARETFREIKPILDAAEYWKAKGSSGESPFMSYGFIGYSKNVPEFCTFTLHVNLEDHTIKYSPVICETPTWSRVGSYRHGRLPDTLTANIELAQSGLNVAQVRQKEKFISQLYPIASGLFPDSPPSIQKLIAVAAALIKVEGEFNPKYVGGTTIVGVIPNGKLPAVAQFVVK